MTHAWHQYLAPGKRDVARGGGGFERGKKSFTACQPMLSLRQRQRIIWQAFVLRVDIGVAEQNNAVAGEKRWLVNEPVLELPLKNQRYHSALGAPGEPVLDVTLRAGDTMYLPRGWLHQALTYPGRHVGTSLFNPDFPRIAESFGMPSECVVEPGQIDAAIRRGLAAQGPYFIEVRTSFTVALPPRSEQGTGPSTGD